MKRYIKANTSFATQQDICDAIKKVFGEYIRKEQYYAQGSKQYVFTLEGHSLELIAGVVDTSYMIPRALYTSSAADRYPCVFKILDNADNMLLLDFFREEGFKEACGYRNSQWGTYKIIIPTYDALLKTYDIYERFLIGEF